MSSKVVSASWGQEHLSDMFTVPGIALNKYLLDIVKWLQQSDSRQAWSMGLLSPRKLIVKFLITFHLFDTAFWDIFSVFHVVFIFMLLFHIWT